MFKLLLKYGVDNLTYKAWEFWIAIVSTLIVFFIERREIDGVLNYTMIVAASVLAILIAVYSFLFSRITPDYIKWYEENCNSNIEETLSPIYLFAFLLSLSLFFGLFIIAIGKLYIFLIAHLFFFSWGFWGTISLYKWSSNLMQTYYDYINHVKGK